ncbi:Transporter [uncultured Candidatus Thioglobus sp.]|nr:Transporter [uncultured Candidatus Thioglobus sp.]
MKKIRKYFISGLLFWIPLGLSIVVISFFLELLDNLVPAQYLPEALFELSHIIPGVGIVLVLLIIFFTGILVSNFIGRKLLQFWDKFLNKIPGFRSVYNALKQLSDTVLSPSGKSFKKALLIEYPRKGLWTIAFKTGDYQGEIADKVGVELVNIYVPTTPNPTSGFFIMLPKDDVIELDMHVDEAFKLIISTGVVEPEQQK